jgi:flavin reductase ActVB
MSDPQASAQDFKEAMARFASGVTIVTTRDASGRPFGFTASAFSSLSLTPPLLLVCLDRGADSFPVFEKCDAFAVSILESGQSDLAMTFATRGADKFAGDPAEDGPALRLPVIKGAIVTLECTLHEQLEGGDHVILIGEVVSARSNDGAPMLHFNRQFGVFRPSAR